MEHKLLRNLLKILSGPWRRWEQPLLLLLLLLTVPSTSSTPPSIRFRLLTQIRRRMRRSLLGFIVDIIWQQRWRATNNVRRMGTNWWDNVNEMALWHWCSCPVMQCYLVHNISPPLHCVIKWHTREWARDIDSTIHRSVFTHSMKSCRKFDFSSKNVRKKIGVENTTGFAYRPTRTIAKFQIYCFCLKLLFITQLQTEFMSFAPIPKIIKILHGAGAYLAWSSKRLVLCRCGGSYTFGANMKMIAARHFHSSWPCALKCFAQTKRMISHINEMYHSQLIFSSL